MTGRKTNVSYVTGEGTVWFSRSVCLSDWLSPCTGRFRHVCVWQNLCHSGFCTLIWEPWTRHGRHFGLCHWFGIELCTPCPSLSVQINDACLWPCIKICNPPTPTPNTHTRTPFLPRTLTCAFNLLCSLRFSFTAGLGNVPSMNIQIIWLL